MEENDTATPDLAEQPGETRGDRIARRVLLTNFGVATAGALAVAGLALTGRGAAAYQAIPTPSHDHALAAATSTPKPLATAAPVDHDEIHKAATAAFPAKTQGQGLQELESRVVGSVREFDLVCGKVRW